MYPGCSSYRSENKSFVHTFNILIKSAFIYRKDSSPPPTAPPHTHPKFLLCYFVFCRWSCQAVYDASRCSCRIFLEAFRKIGDHVKYDHFVFDQMMSTVCFSLRRCYPYDLCIWTDSCNLSSLFRFQAGYPIFDLLAKILKLLFWFL